MLKKTCNDVTNLYFTSTMYLLFFRRAILSALYRLVVLLYIITTIFYIIEREKQKMYI